MNEKKAREIVSAHLESAKKDNFPYCGCHECEGAKWYLEAIEKARGLVEALRFIDRRYEHWAGKPLPHAKDAIAKWEKEK